MLVRAGAVAVLVLVAAAPALLVAGKRRSFSYARGVLRVTVRARTARLRLRP